MLFPTVLYSALNGLRVHVDHLCDGGHGHPRRGAGIIVSKYNVNLAPGLAHGTSAVRTPHSGQSVRGTLAWMNVYAFPRMVVADAHPAAFGTGNRRSPGDGQIHLGVGVAPPSVGDSTSSTRHGSLRCRQSKTNCSRVFTMPCHRGIGISLYTTMGLGPRRLPRPVYGPGNGRGLSPTTCCQPRACSCPRSARGSRGC